MKLQMGAGLFQSVQLNRGNPCSVKMVSTGWQHRLKPVITAAFGAFLCHADLQSDPLTTSVLLPTSVYIVIFAEHVLTMYQSEYKCIEFFALQLIDNYYLYILSYIVLPGCMCSPLSVLHPLLSPSIAPRG